MAAMNSINLASCRPEDEVGRGEEEEKASA